MAVRKENYAVITGASAGIGRSFAKELAQRGYSLVLVARREHLLKTLAGELMQEYNINCRIYVCDVSKEDECQWLIEEIAELPVEIFINNAGFGDCGIFTETSLTKEMNMIDVNVKALHRLMKLMLQRMEEQNHGYILNIASSAGLLPAGPYMATYYATKAYVTSLTQGVARELHEKKSRVYVGCVCPGPVNTEFNSVANVEFALRGISADSCVQYSLKQMFRRKTVIVPSFGMKAAVVASRLAPRRFAVAITARQQKKKIYKK